MSNDPYAEKYFERGHAAYEQGDLETALKELTQAIGRNSMFTDAYFFRGLAYKDTKQYERAIEDFTHVAKQDPDTEVGFSMRAYCYDNLGRYEEALADCTRWIVFDSSAAGAYFLRGTIYYKTGKYSEALDDLDQTISLRPDLAMPFVFRGRVYHKVEQYSKALDDFNQAINLNPDMDVGYIERANIYCELQRDNESLQDAQQAIQLNPQNPQPYHILGLLFLRNGDRPQALSYYDQAAQLGDELAAEQAAKLREKIFDDSTPPPQESSLPIPSTRADTIIESSIVQQQREIVRAHNQHVHDYVQRSNAIREQLSQEIPAAESELKKAQQKASEELNQAQQRADSALSMFHTIKHNIENELSRCSMQLTVHEVLPEAISIETDKSPAAQMGGRLAKLESKIVKTLEENLEKLDKLNDQLKELENTHGLKASLKACGMFAFSTLLFGGLAYFTWPTVIGIILFAMTLVLGVLPLGITVFIPIQGVSLKSKTQKDILQVQQTIIQNHKQVIQSVVAAEKLHNLWLVEAQNIYKHQVSDAHAEHERATSQAQQRYEQQLQSLKQEKARFEATWQANVRTFSEDVNYLSPDPAWKEWKPARSASSILRIGSFTPPFPENFCVPLYTDFPGNRALLFKCSGAVKATAVAAVQATILRLLATIPPGKVKFTFIDPVGLGQNVAPFMRLADPDYDDSLVNSKAWTDPRHIEQRLANLTEHMETVIQKYLQNKYATIEEYNAQAEVAEPYQVLVVFDYPVNFSDEAARRLVSIAQNGPRCGVFTIVLADLEKPEPYGVKLKELERTSTVVMRKQQDDSFIINDEDYRGIDLQLEKLPNDELVNRILNTVGQASTEASKVEVPFDRIVPAADQWWTQDSSSSLVVPIGPSGAHKHQKFEVGKGTAHHALVVGKTGSGKSSLLHSLITSIAMNYSPEEVELYLIDFKKGVEFKTYATHRLPHARVIAIESEREFGLSVLEGLYQKYEERGGHFGNAHVNRLDAYREATGRPMPRILLLVDEFHKFFIEQDKIATRAYQLLELLVREGRSAGIHVLLASQTLTGSASLPNSIKEQIGIRVALQCSEADSRLILSDDNPAARGLSRPGEAIYNEANGLVEGNNNFQVAFLGDEPKERYLQEIQQFAQHRNFQTSQIVFEGNQPADIEKNNELQTALTSPAPTKSPRSLKAWVGEPTAIREPTAVTFQRECGNNLLMVGTDEQAAMGILVTSIISLAAQLPHTSVRGAQTFSVLDFSTTDTEETNPFNYLAEKLPHPIAVGRRRQLPGMINVVAQEVQRRLQDDETGAPPIFLIIYGLQRARVLRLDEPGTGYGANTFTPEDSAPSQEAQELGMSSSFASQFGTAGSTAAPAAASNPSQQLPMILREGPDFGVYTLVWCDTMNNLNRTLERSALREFILRIAFQMSENDSHNFVESSAANKLGDHRALLYNDEKGTGEKFRPYAVPSQQWLAQAIDQLQG